MTPMFSTNRPATVVLYSSVYGGEPLADSVRSVGVSIQPYAQYPVAALIEYKKPRERRLHGVWVYPNNITYAQIEQGGTVVYDSREDVPCDMKEWKSTAARFRRRIAADTARVALSVNARVEGLNDADL